MLCNARKKALEIEFPEVVISCKSTVSQLAQFHAHLTPGEQVSLDHKKATPVQSRQKSLAVFMFKAKGCVVLPL